MSAVALANLAKLWGKLRFATVDRVVARDPEDVLSITVHNARVSENGNTYLNHTDTSAPRFRRVADIPVELRYRTDVAWRNYYGFTQEGVFFHRDNFIELDTNHLTLSWGSQSGGFDKPRRGDVICGEVGPGPRGMRFVRWFVCSAELKFLIELVRAGQTSLTEAQLASRLVINGYPDQLWALARLLFFDNVHAFVESYLGTDAVHPCFGQPYGKPDPGGKRFTIEHRGMWLACTPARFVHVLSRVLEEPQWWSQFKERLGSTPECVGLGGVCPACQAERDAARGYDLPDWPHAF